MAGKNKSDYTNLARGFGDSGGYEELGDRHSGPRSAESKRGIQQPGSHSSNSKVSTHDSTETDSCVHLRRLNDKTTKILLRSIDPNDIILSFLVSEEIMSTKTYQTILSIPHLNQQKRNERLIKWLKGDGSKKKLETFVRILDENDQEHVANYLRRKEDGKLPMSDGRHRRLTQIKPKLMKCVCYTGVLHSALLSKSAISETDSQNINSSTAEYEQIGAMIDAILRRSDCAFDSLVEALIDCGQHELAEFMVIGIVVSVHVNTTDPSLDEDLARAVRADCTRQEGANEKSDELYQNHIRIVGAEPGHSVMVHMYCRSAQETQHLLEMIENGKILTIMDHLFRRLSTDHHLRVETVHLDGDELMVCKGFIERKLGKPKVGKVPDSCAKHEQQTVCEKVKAGQTPRVDPKRAADYSVIIRLFGCIGRGGNQTSKANIPCKQTNVYSDGYYNFRRNQPTLCENSQNRDGKNQKTGEFSVDIPKNYSVYSNIFEGNETKFEGSR